MLYFLLYKLLNMFRATMCPLSGSDDWLVFSPRVGIVLWLQEGCQNRLVGSVSIEEFVAQLLLCYDSYTAKRYLSFTEYTMHSYFWSKKTALQILILNF